jgi:hypothetical protein
MKRLLFLFLCVGLRTSLAQNAPPNWGVGVAVPENGRSNILNFSSFDRGIAVSQGRLHAQIYPVQVTAVLPPYQPIKNLVEDRTQNPLKDLIDQLVQHFSKVQSFDSFLARLGLHEYPKESDSGIYSVPYPNGQRPDYRIGFGTLERNHGVGFTFSCAACHSAELFGKTVLGLTNRFPRANDFFVKAKKIAPYYNSWFFKTWSGESADDRLLMDQTISNLQRVAVKEPINLGLDTSLSQVALSLNRREPDDQATPSKYYEDSPRADDLDTTPADSKPAVWWNVKYKNRWLSDGSVVSGNPIYTNLLWNEVGRGADLGVLSTWLKQNQRVVDELTAAVFASEAPRITDFFRADKIDLASAQKGEALFNQKCSRCHGTYEKTWSSPGASAFPLAEQLKTSKVIPKKDTPVEDVGTDPLRHQGMKSLLQLNDLAISKANNILIQVQGGYVPPPLVGIWARWPYMHNNSIPSLCEVLTPAKDRQKSYYAGEAKNTQTDFDFDCNGYPSGESTPQTWKTPEFLYDTSREGMSNAGHDDDIFIENGINTLSKQDKKNLIQYLQTL